MTKEELHRGLIAKAITESQDFKDLIAYIRSDLFKQFSQTSIGADEELRRVHQTAYGIELLLTRCARYIDHIQRNDEDEEQG